MFKFAKDKIFSKRRNKGSAMIFTAAVIMPLAFFLFSLSLDLSRYRVEENRAQLAADKAAMQAFKYLPFTQPASIAAKNELTSAGFGNCSNVLLSSDNIAVSIACDFKPSFAQYFSENIRIPYTAYAQARTVPLDAYFALDASSNVAPQIETEFWGDAEIWQAAEFFKTTFPIAIGGKKLDTRYLTQQCFNPLFSGIKQSAIKLFDYFSAFNLNALGLGFFPGDILPVFSTKNSANSPVILEQYASLIAADSYCAGVAEQESKVLQYRFPLGVNGAASPADLVRVEAPSYRFSPEYLNSATVRESIWSKAAKLNIPINTKTVFTQVFSEVLSVSNEQAPALTARRGGLKNQAKKLGVIFTSDLPLENAQRFPDGQTELNLRAELRKLGELAEQSKQEVSIIYVIYKNPARVIAGFDNRFLALRNLFAEISESYPKLNLLSFTGNNSDEILNQTVNYLALLQRNIRRAK